MRPLIWAGMAAVSAVALVWLLDREIGRVAAEMQERSN